MKAFLEEYGFVILIAIVIILLIVMATPVGNSIKASILGLVDRFSGTATSKLDKADQGDFTASIRQATGDAAVYLDLNSDSTTDQYSYTVTYVSGGKTATTKELVKVKAVASPATPAQYFKNGEKIVIVDKTNKAVAGGDTIDDGSTIYVTVTNIGTNEVVQSNSIKFHQLSASATLTDTISGVVNA